MKQDDLFAIGSDTPAVVQAGRIDIIQILEKDDVPKLREVLSGPFASNIITDTSVFVACVQHNALGCVETLIRAGIPPPTFEQQDAIIRELISGDRVGMFKLLDGLGFNFKFSGRLFSEATLKQRYVLAAEYIAGGWQAPTFTTCHIRDWASFERLYREGAISPGSMDLDYQFVEKLDPRMSAWLGLDYRTSRRNANKPVSREVSRGIQRFIEGLEQGSIDLRLVAAHQAAIEKDGGKRKAYLAKALAGMNPAGDIVADVCMRLGFGQDWAADLISAGLPLDYRVNGRETLTDHAIRRQNTGAIEEFARHRVPFSGDMFPDDFYTTMVDLSACNFTHSALPRVPLLALLAGNTCNLESAVSRVPSLVHQKGRDSRSALMHPLMVGSLNRIIEAGADVLYADRRGRTPLHYVADFAATFQISDAAEQIACLLGSGANPTARDITGQSPIDIIESAREGQGSPMLQEALSILERAVRQSHIARALNAAAPSGSALRLDIL